MLHIYRPVYDTILANSGDNIDHAIVEYFTISSLENSIPPQIDHHKMLQFQNSIDVVDEYSCERQHPLIPKGISQLRISDEERS